MSGIGGVQTFDGSAPCPSLMSALGRALVHRGPDGEARYTSGGTGLLHAALAAATSALDQPFVGPSGRVAVADGRVFVPDNDQQGDVALAACEPAEDRVTLSRDAFGLRPLYYAETPRGLVFASEPRAIVASGLVPASVNSEALRELVQTQFTTGRQTLFEGITRVLPGETIVAARGRVVERTRAVALPQGIDRTLSDRAALDRFGVLLSQAMAACFTEPGETGVLFTGRIEASALAAGLKQDGRRGVPLYAVVCEGPGAATMAAHTTKVARAVGAEPVLASLGPADFFGMLPRVVAILDDPGADYAAVALYRVAAEAARDVRTLATAAGGDVLFGGLGRYRSVLRPLWLGGRSMRARGILEGLGVLREETPSWRDGLRATESRLAEWSCTRLQAAQALDCALWLPNDVLPALDRCMSAHSIDARAPYLDLALASFGFTLPDHLKIAGARGSALIRRWVARILPESDPFTRRCGHSVPATRWIAEAGSRLAPLVSGQAGIVALCDRGAVRRLFERLSFLPSKRLGQAAWQLLFYALWHRIHIEGTPADGDVFDVLA